MYEHEGILIKFLLLVALFANSGASPLLPVPRDGLLFSRASPMTNVKCSLQNLPTNLPCSRAVDTSAALDAGGVQSSSRVEMHL